MSNRTYWAAAPAAEIVREIEPKIDAHYEWLRTSGRLALWSRVHRQYYAGIYEGGRLGSKGEHDELVSVNVNHFRNLGQHLLIMATSQRPSFEPRAVNSDHRSQAQTILASGILDHVLKAKNLEECLTESVEASLLYFDGYLAVDWDANAGTDFAVEPGEGEGSERIRKSGDVVFRCYLPLDVVSDHTKTRGDEHKWYIVRRWANRWDLAAKYPELSERIIAAPSAADITTRPRYIDGASTTFDKSESDDVEVWDFYHDRADAMPEGRKVTFLLGCGDMPPLFDGPLPYDDLSLYRVSPAPMLGTAHGYSPLIDLLSLQQATNALWTTNASNVAAFGTQNIWTREGDNIGLSQLAGGLNHIQSREPPQPLQLTANSADSYKLIELLDDAMETISGVNSVARGNPEASLKSGAALALVQAQAIQFSAGLQKSTVRFQENVVTGVVRMYKRYATTPQVALIAGKANRGFLQEFTGSDLDRIDRVSIEVGNPLARTISGRVQMAEHLLMNGMVKTPDEYIQVVSTGKLEPMIEATQKEMLAIKSENERLSDGANQQPMPGAQPMPSVIAMVTDNHPAHMREHAAVIASPDSRDNPAVVASVTAHIQEHAELWRTMDPAIGAALQIPPPPMPMAPPMPGGPQDGTQPPPQGATSSTEAPPAPAMDATGPLGPSPFPMPNMPNMPKNPLTGERAEVPQPTL
jgi:hypothetical protein